MQDSLRGSITPARSWWDLNHYLLNVRVFPYQKYLEGSNTITYTVLKPDSIIQIDLQAPMEITQVEQNNKNLDFKKNGNAWFIKLSDQQLTGRTYQLRVNFNGKPKVSKNPPWDDGLTWKRDHDKIPYIGTSCQGGGASIWWPCKDHMYDEPDSMTISITVPENLIAVSNGWLRKSFSNISDSTKTYEWVVSNPINNYAVCMNIANYKHFSEKYEGLTGDLNCDYYVLPNNIEKARNHFKQVPKMLEAFEYWFGPYPFYKDGYKLVEAPFLGMEHQSCIAYGNQYKMGYLSLDLSGTGLGYTFDYIIVHESAHEWFGNSITYKDIADMWIHESFATYAESLFVEYYNNKEAGAKYVIGTRQNILNDKPIIGHYDVNDQGSGDMYTKGANMLHIIRQLLNNDSLWHNILRDINVKFYHQVVDAKQIEQFLIDKTGLDLQPVFDQYLRNTDIPILEYRINGKKLEYRWTNCIQTFNMPVRVYINDIQTLLKPEKGWKTQKLDNLVSKIVADPNFYIKIKLVTN
jgi:aminopeptidase N